IFRGIEYRRQKAINLKYKGKEAGLHRIDFLINFTVLRLKQAIKRLIFMRTQRGGSKKVSNFLILKDFSVFSVVNF
ncbi:MAG: hypothetical protein ABH869_02810, partial [Candidatus Omnitrophota bacterium]